jgi:hypothetical protein
MDRKDEQALADNVDADPKQGTPSRKFLPWPPPGLEAVQGKLWPPIALIALGDATLILPLLWSIATQQEPWSFGPFGGNWWVPLLTTFVGLVVLLMGLGRLFGLLRLAAKAGKRGHGWLVVVQVVADFPRDTGFLLQGARLFSETPPAKRSLMLVTRVIGAGAYILAALWVPLGFIVSLLIGARGLLGPAGVWFITVAPAALLLLVGLLSRLLGRKLSWEANRDSTLRAAVDEEICSQIAEWNDESSSMRKDLGFDGAVAPHSRSFRLGALSVALLAVFVLVPVVTVTLTGAVGTVLAAIAVPSFNNPQARVAVAEMLRHHKLEPDGSVTAEQAGEALHALLSVNLDTHERVLDRAPVRVYGLDWFPEDVDSLISGSRGEWARGLFERVGRGLGPDERAYLADLGAHPAHAEFRTIAMADSVDIIGARYVLPFPDTVTPFELPIPSFVAIRNGTDAHVALAALQLSQGNQSRAEETIREVISLGFAMIDEGSSIIDGMIGARVVDVGAQALELLFGATGRTGEAESLRWLRTGMEAALERAAVTRTGFDAEGALRMMPDAVLDETVLRGIRWEYFLTFATLAPCVNLNNVVFGAGQSYEQWLEDAEQALVRRPSDEAMFRFLEKGWFRGAGAAEAPAWIKAALRFTFGEASGGTCAAQLGAMDMVGVL